MNRARRRLSIAVLTAAMVLGVGSTPVAHAATAKSLEIVLVTQLTSWSAFPYQETFTGSGVGSDLQIWSFTETVTYNHFLAYGTFSMQAGADRISGTVSKSPSYVPFVPLSYDLEAWSYTVTDGQGAYAGCTGHGATQRRRATPPLLPPSGVVVQATTFDLTCP